MPGEAQAAGDTVKNPYNQAEFEAAFLLAGFAYSEVVPIPNGYCSQSCCSDTPWFLFATEFGKIKIGWRKRVINIDWSDTPFRGRITKDDVTRGDDFTHAWGYGKAVTYLQELLGALRRHRRDSLREEASAIGLPCT
jgi:hypothetical protein